MKNKEFRHDSVMGFMTHAEGSTLVIEGAAFLPEEIDFTNIEAIKILATRAVNTANGLYELIKNNCDINNPDLSLNSHLETYLSLSGLACEIYMKSIIYNENLHKGKKNTLHKLDELFNMLPDSIKESLKHDVNKIDIVLPTIKDLFTELRYDFELNHIQGEYFIIFDFMEKLNIISNGYPKKVTGSIRSANGVLSFR